MRIFRLLCHVGQHLKDAAEMRGFNTVVAPKRLGCVERCPMASPLVRKIRLGAVLEKRENIVDFMHKITMQRGEDMEIMFRKA